MFLPCVGLIDAIAVEGFAVELPVAVDPATECIEILHPCVFTDPTQRSDPHSIMLWDRDCSRFDLGIVGMFPSQDYVVASHAFAFEVAFIHNTFTIS